MNCQNTSSQHGMLDKLGREQVTSLHRARRVLHEHLQVCGPVETEAIDLLDGLGRITGADITAPEDLPSHPRSIMDGYAVQAGDTYGATETLPAYMEISGEVRMGEMPDSGPAPQSCYKIATGGLLPPGTDAVIMLEHTVEIDGHMIEVTKAVAPGANIIARGDDVRKGHQLLAPGHQLRPQDLGLLAGLGINRLEVYRRPRVGIFSTGDEIVPATENPPQGKIRDANSTVLQSMVRQIGATARHYGITRDEEDQFTDILKTALEENDLVIFSGSSSVGSRDLGEIVMQKLTPPGIILHGVGIKPGKPVLIAFADRKPVYGLPGHPVSAAVAFDLFVRPAVNHLSGLHKSILPWYRTIRARLARSLNSAAGRTDFIRVEIHRKDDRSYEATPVLGRSGALSTMVKADGFIVIAEDLQGLYEGDSVEVFLYY